MFTVASRKALSVNSVSSLGLLAPWNSVDGWALGFVEPLERLSRNGFCRHINRKENAADDKVINEAVTDSHRFTSLKSTVKHEGCDDRRPSIGHTRHSIREMLWCKRETTVGHHWSCLTCNWMRPRIFIMARAMDALLSAGRATKVRRASEERPAIIVTLRLDQTLQQFAQHPHVSTITWSLQQYQPFGSALSPGLLSTAKCISNWRPSEAWDSLPSLPRRAQCVFTHKAKLIQLIPNN